MRTNPGLLNVEEGAAYLRVSPSLVYRLCQEGRLPHVRIGGRGRRGKVLLHLADLEAFLAACRVQGPDGEGPLEHLR
jgi:excisionase family DNA binding protein